MFGWPSPRISVLGVVSATYNDAIVRLKRGSGPSDAITILSFSNGSQVADLKLDWVGPRHLSVNLPQLCRAITYLTHSESGGRPVYGAATEHVTVDRVAHEVHEILCSFGPHLNTRCKQDAGCSIRQTASPARSAHDPNRLEGGRPYEQALPGLQPAQDP